MLNKAQVIGNLGTDPRAAKSQNGSSIASFTVATTERGYTTQSGTVIPDKTEWHNVVCFGKLADIVIKYLRKGSKVFIEGKMRTRSYAGKDGIERKVMEINAENIEMLDSKPSGNSAPQQQQFNDPYSAGNCGRLAYGFEIKKEHCRDTGTGQEQRSADYGDKERIVTESTKEFTPKSIGKGGGL